MQDLGHVQMKVKMIYPPAVGKINGNMVTTQRCAKIFQNLGYEVSMETEFTHSDADIILALHAYKSYPVIKKMKIEHPDKRIIVMLTGTDIYSESLATFETQESLQIADKIVVLQKEALSLIPNEYQKKTHVIFQSVEEPEFSKNLSSEYFDICLIGNLRQIKDPFILAEALHGLPKFSKIRVNHIGGALEKSMADRARDFMKSNDRYIWHGELDYRECQKILNNSHLMVLSSIAEGGANVISEAITLGVPVICSEISCTVGLLGNNYPGFFEVGHVKELHNMISKAETQSNFLRSLSRWGQNLKERFSVDTELNSWKELLTFS